VRLTALRHDIRIRSVLVSLNQRGTTAHRDQEQDVNHSTGTCRTRKAAVVGALLAATVAPLMMTATPAQASTTLGGCTVTPYAPRFAGYFNNQGVKMIRFQVEAKCDANRTLIVYWQGFEADPWYWAPDDPIFTARKPYNFDSAGTIRPYIDHPLPNTEDDAEEVYHRVNFRVCEGSVCSERTAWERTPEVSFTN